MGSWRDSLQAASFRGVPFEVMADSVPVGRRVQVHEFVQRDTPYAEDLGRATRQRLCSEIGWTEGGEHLGQAGRRHGRLRWASAVQAVRWCRSAAIAPDESSAWSY